MLPSNRFKEVLPSFSWLSRDFSLRSEILAALVGAILVIPQGITFSFLVGVPIDHGLYCAIFVTFITALWGNSTMMSGPNTATAILLGLSVSPLVSSGEVFTQKVMLLTLMAGTIQLLIWLFGGGRLFQIITRPAISGIMMAVGVLIMLSASEKILGIASLKQVHLANFRDTVQFYSMLVGATTIGAGLLTHRKWKKSYILISMAVGIALSIALNLVFSSSVVRLDYLGEVALGQMVSGVQNLGRVNMDSAVQLLPAAFAIAFISLAQSMVISMDLKNRQDGGICLSREVFAIGLANFLAPFVGAYAGSGSFNRTQVNEEMEARTPLAAILSAFFVLFILLAVGRLFLYIPVPVIAGVLFIVGLKMVRWSSIRLYMERHFDFLTFLCIFVASLWVGIIASTGLALVFSFISIKSRK